MSWDVDSDEEGEVTSGKTPCKRKMSNKDEQLEVLVSELKQLHAERYMPMQYRIWGEMLNCGLYSSKTDAPSTSTFSRAGGNELKKRKLDVAEAIGEVAKQMSVAFSGTASSISHSTVDFSPERKIKNRSKCYKQLNDLKNLRKDGILSEEKYQSEKEAIMKTW